MKKILSMFLVVVLIFSNIIFVFAAEEGNEQQTGTTITKTLYRYRQKQYKTTYHLSSHESDWTVYNTESINELCEAYYNVISNDILGYNISYWQEYYSGSDFRLELETVAAKGYAYNTRIDGKGVNIYSQFWWGPVNAAHTVGTKCYDSVYGTVYYTGTVSQIYNLYVYFTTKYYLWGWSKWSGWSEVPVAPSETVEVETKESDIMYRYRTKSSTSSKTKLKEPWVLYDTTSEYEHSNFRTLELAKSDSISSSYCVHDKESVDKYIAPNGNSWFYATTSEYIKMLVNNPSLSTYHCQSGYYRYTYCTSKKLYTLYHYYKWSEWSEWSYTPVETSDSVEVETKIAMIFSVNYDANGGIGAPENTIKQFNETVIISEAMPTKENYQFIGWSTSLNGDVEYIPGGEYSLNADVILYAVWHSHIYDNDCDTDCNDCGEIRETNHKYGDWVVTNAPTCAENGSKYKECSVCGDKVEESISKTNEHSYFEIVTIPTCIEQGYTTYTCSTCGDSYDDAYVKAKGHKYNNNCDTTCNNCDYIREITHSYGNWIIDEEPTCVESGSKHKMCGVCGNIITETVSATGKHDFVAVITKPTCTSVGYTIYTCDCGMTYKSDYTSETGHSYFSSITTPTCTQVGYTTHTCVVCDDSYKDTYVEAKGHKYNNTCDTTCNNCDYIREITHSYGNWIIDEEPTCVESGFKHKMCSVCGDIITETVSATGKHNYVEKIVLPTCIDKGYVLLECKCGDKYISKYIDESAHVFGNDNICDVCGYTDRILGDCNNDRVIDTTDLATMKLFLAGLNELTGSAELGADLNQDGNIDTTDLASLKLKLAGL